MNPSQVPVYSGEPSAYEEWSTNFSAAAEFMDLWEMFSAAPPAAVDAEADPAAVAAAAAVKLRWDSGNRKGFALLMRALTPEDLSLVAHLRGKDNAAKAAWDLLQSRKLMSGEAAKNAAVQKLMQNFMQHDETVQAYLGRCTDLWREHQRLGGPIDEKAYLCNVVQNLSPDWDSLQEALQAEGPAGWMRESVWSRLLNVEQRR